MAKGLMEHVKPKVTRGAKNQRRKDPGAGDFFIDMGRDSASRFNPKLPKKNNT